jgi:aspartate racemase
MDLQADNIIGIVGGMGPQAGVALFNSILKHTAATVDQQHLSVIMMSFPRHIMDRTLFLEGQLETNPAINITAIIRKLEADGARVIGMACNTSHVPEIYDVIAGELNRVNSHVKLVHMPREACRYLKETCPHIRRVGLMTTNGTYKSGLYKNLLLRLGYDVITPDPTFQDQVIHRMIYDETFGIKAKTDGVSPQVVSLLEKSLSFFERRGAEAVILGCTELSFVLNTDQIRNMRIIDASDALARALIREATQPFFQTDHSNPLKHVGIRSTAHHRE